MPAFHLSKGVGSDDSDMKQQSRLATPVWGFGLLGHERSKLYIKDNVSDRVILLTLIWCKFGA